MRGNLTRDFYSPRFAFLVIGVYLETRIRNTEKRAGNTRKNQALPTNIISVRLPFYVQQFRLHCLSDSGKRLWRVNH
jgi:hypothetical protein